MLDPNDPSQILMEAVIRSAVAEGMELGSDALRAGWKKLRGLVGKWSGDKSDAVAEAIDDVIEKPDKEGRQQDLAKALAAVGADVDTDLLDVARTLRALLAADPETAAPTAGVVQIVGNAYKSPVIQIAGEGSATVHYGQKKRT